MKLIQLSDGNILIPIMRTGSQEVMWDLLEIMDSKELISMPSVLKGGEAGKEHFGDICFIVVIEERD